MPSTQQASPALINLPLPRPALCVPQKSAEKGKVSLFSHKSYHTPRAGRVSLGWLRLALPKARSVEPFLVKATQTLHPWTPFEASIDL